MELVTCVTVTREGQYLLISQDMISCMQCCNVSGDLENLPRNRYFQCVHHGSCMVLSWATIIAITTISPIHHRHHHHPHHHTNLILISTPITQPLHLVSSPPSTSPPPLHSVPSTPLSPYHHDSPYVHTTINPPQNTYTSHH